MALTVIDCVVSLVGDHRYDVPLVAVSVTLPPAVRVGDVVQAQASIGSVHVMGALTVLDNGAEGAVVRVVNRESKREVRARVVRAGVVEVLHE